MPSERVQRRIDRLLDQAEDAVDAMDWERVREASDSVLVVDTGNEDAKSFLAMAAHHLGGSEDGGNANQVEVAPTTTPASDTPSSFANGRYSVDRLLGEGGKKKVYLAHDAILDRDVAFAVIKTEGLDEVGRERIRREAQAMGRMGTHPCIMPIYDLGEEDGNPYMVQPLMSGGDVEELIEDADGPLPLERAIRIATQTAQGLVFAHSKGIIHRDLKPGNIWLDDDGNAKIGDFGLAIATDRSRLTVEKLMVGTVNYMPPEQATGGEVTSRADLYSLGAMLYEMCTGRVPFMGDDDIAVISQHVNTPPVAPSWHNPSIPKTLDSLIIRMMSKDPGERPQSAEEVLAALGAVDLSAVEDTEEAGKGSLDSMAGGVFVGRQREMDNLKSIFEEVLSGKGRMVTIVGEPGIGKTRTAQELATYASMRGAKVLWGRSYESGGAPPYWPWVQAIRSHVASTEPDTLRDQMGSAAPIIAEIVADVREKLSDLSDAPKINDPESARFRLFDSISTFLKRVSSGTPMVLMLEDLHWSDKPSLTLLEFVVRELANEKIMIVGNYRDVELNRRHPLSVTLGDLSRERLFERIILRGLQKHDVERFIEIAAGISPPPALVDAVFTQTEGNPLFVTETVRLLIQEGDITAGRATRGGTTSWEIRIPEGVREVIGRRLDRLSERCNEVLTLAAVVGRQFRFNVLQQLVEETTEGQLLDALDESLSARIVEELADEIGLYQFTHAQMQETLTAELSANRLVRIHARIAEALEAYYGDDAENHAAELAEHFAEAETVLGNEKVIAYRTLAGHQASAAYAYEQAAMQFKAALSSFTPENDQLERAELHLQIGIAETNYQFGFSQLSGQENLLEAFNIFEKLGETDKALQPAAEQYSSLVLPPGIELARRALALVKEDSANGSLVLSRYSIVDALEGGKLTNSMEFLSRAIDMAVRIGDEKALTWGLIRRSVLHIFEDDFEAVLEYYEEYLETAKDNNDGHAELVAESFAGTANIYLGRPSQAMDSLNAALHLAETLGLTSSVHINRGYLLKLARLNGRWKQEIDIPSPFGPGAISLHGVCTSIETTGRLEEEDLQAVSAQLSLMMQPFHDEQGAGVGYALLNNLITLPDANSIPELKTIVDLVYRSSKVPRTMRNSAVIAITYGAVADQDVAKCSQLLDELKGFSGRISGSVQTDRILGLLAAATSNYESAENYFNKALKFCRSADYRPELARSCSDYSQMLLTRGAPGDVEKATELQDEAIAIARELGMQPLLERVLSQRGILKA